MSENATLLLVGFGIALTAIIFRWIEARENVRNTRVYAEFSRKADKQLLEQPDYLEFIEWLDEKGAKREGFRSNPELVMEFLEWQDELA